MKTEIIIKGKKYPCRMTLGALRMFKRMTGHDVSNIAPGDIDEMLLFVYCCVASASRGEGVEMPWSNEEEMADCLDVAEFNEFFDVQSPEGDSGKEEKKT